MPGVPPNATWPHVIHVLHPPHSIPSPQVVTQTYPLSLASAPRTPSLSPAHQGPANGPLGHSPPLSTQDSPLCSSPHATPTREQTNKRAAERERQATPNPSLYLMERSRAGEWRHGVVVAASAEGGKLRGGGCDSASAAVAGSASGATTAAGSTCSSSGSGEIGEQEEPAVAGSASIGAVAGSCASCSPSSLFW